VSPIDLLHAVVLGVVEGITEFLPISSTGHLIVVGDWLGFTGDRAKTFEIFIQFGAILAILWIYRTRFTAIAREIGQPANRQLIINLLLAFFPAALLGLLTHHWIKAHLFSPVVVAWALIAGGVLMIGIERLRPEVRVDDAMAVEPGSAFGIGLAQMLALIPGVSRSGATIMGGYTLGLSRTAATEFSFFLAVPVISAAAGYDLLKSLDVLSLADLPLFAVGFVVSFLSALVVVKALLRYIAHHSFESFGWYRIGFGLLLLYLQAAHGIESGTGQ